MKKGNLENMKKERHKRDSSVALKYSKANRDHKRTREKAKPDFLSPNKNAGERTQKKQVQETVRQTQPS